MEERESQMDSVRLGEAGECSMKAVEMWGLGSARANRAFHPLFTRRRPRPFRP